MPGSCPSLLPGILLKLCRVDDVIQPAHPAFNHPQHPGLFQLAPSLCHVPKYCRSALPSFTIYQILYNEVLLKG